jgi:hypothetical protein
MVTPAASSCPAWHWPRITTWQLLLLLLQAGL